MSEGLCDYKSLIDGINGKATCPTWMFNRFRDKPEPDIDCKNCPKAKGFGNYSYQKRNSESAFFDVRRNPDNPGRI